MLAIEAPLAGLTVEHRTGQQSGLFFFFFIKIVTDEKCLRVY